MIINIFVQYVWAIGWQASIVALQCFPDQDIAKLGPKCVQYERVLVGSLPWEAASRIYFHLQTSASA